MIKIANKVGMEAIYLNTINAIYEMSTASITINGEKPKLFF
jgi:hypothetical protein